VAGRLVQRGALSALAVALALITAESAPAAKKPTRYSLAGGCHSLESAGQPVAGAERLRMQATTLGRYLLYTPDRTFLAAQDDGSVAPDAEPSPAADWRVKGRRGSFTLSPVSDPSLFLAVGPNGALTVAEAATRFTFTRAKGCPRYPEAKLSARGKPSRGETSYGAVGGFLEGHMHWMTFEYFGGEFHCGRPWHPYGIPYALPDCSEVEGPQGTAAPTQNFLNFGNPAEPHDTTGWPKLTEWRKDNLTYEGTYWRWIERAWMSGLRLMVMSVNENRVLCQLQARRRHGCDEMDTVRRGFQDIRELQRYVDAQAGGPGKGFFKIVTNPFQARRVINRGKMAVVLEIEVSELFGCRGWENPSCDRAQVDQQLDEFHRLGVRSSLLLNKFDNPLTGVRFDSGEIGTLINAGNRESAGSFWDAETCTGPLHDNTIETFSPEGSAFFDGLLGSVGVSSGQIPTYPPAPHCNTRGLTDLGRHLEREMIERKMIINPDHMSQRAVDETLTIAEANDYSGVISPHGWMDPGNWPRIWKLGGLAFPDSDTSTGFLSAHQKYRPKRTPYKLGWGYGADLGGLAAQPGAPEGAPQITYPFKSYDGKVTFQRQRTGERTFDYTTEGVAHYGLYADWFEDLQARGDEQMASDMWNGAEAYLEMWERAHGIRSRGCKPTSGHVNADGLGRIRLGASWKSLLRRAGQPQERTRAWSWCVRGPQNRRTADVAELTPGGRVELVGSTANGRSADGIHVGARARRLGEADRAGGGVFTREDGGATYAYAVRDGRVRAVAVASDALADDPARLRGAMRRLGNAKATNARPRFVPNQTAGSTRLTGTNLAGSSDPRLNRALVMLCSLQP
jgi:hypothetical protein